MCLLTVALFPFRQGWKELLPLEADQHLRHSVRNTARRLQTSSLGALSFFSFFLPLLSPLKSTTQTILFSALWCGGTLNEKHAALYLKRGENHSMCQSSCVLNYIVNTSQNTGKEVITITLNLQMVKWRHRDAKQVTEHHLAGSWKRQISLERYPIVTRHHIICYVQFIEVIYFELRKNTFINSTVTSEDLSSYPFFHNCYFSVLQLLVKRGYAEVSAPSSPKRDPRKVFEDLPVCKT